MISLVRRASSVLCPFVATLALGGSALADDSEPKEADASHGATTEPAHEGSEGEGHDAGHDEHATHHRFLVGAKGGYAIGFADEEVHHLGGGGLFFEVIAIPRWLALELVVKGMTSGHGANLPITLLIKKPFHASPAVHPFIGLGPTVVPTFGDHETSVHFGGVVAAGAHFWVAKHWALVAEIEYALLSDHGLVQELGVNAGVAFGW